MKTEVLVTGTFSIVHAGHVRLLEFASRYGSVTVGINADPYLRKKYGDKAVPLIDRTYVLSSNKFVDKVIVFMEDTPAKLIKKLKPKVYVRGPDYLNVELPEQEALTSVGAHVIIQPAVKEYSSTELVENLPEKVFKKLDKYT